MPPTRYGPMPYTAEGKAIAEALNAQDGGGSRMADAARARTEGGNSTRRREFESKKPPITPTQLAQRQGQEKKLDLDDILEALLRFLSQSSGPSSGPPQGPPQVARRGLGPTPGMPPQQMQRPGMTPQMQRPPQRLA